MNTNNFFILGIASLIILSTASCSKEGTRLFEGKYSYKLSGTIEVERCPVSTPTQPLDTITVQLPDESGQMYILNMGGSDGTMLVTMNAMIGSVNKMEATADGSKLRIKEASRHQNVYDGIEQIGFQLEVNGEGHKYDDVVIFDLHYGGETEGRVYNYRILDSKVECVAREN